MFVHVVLFTLQDTADIPEAVRMLRNMAGNIESLRSVEVGAEERMSPRSAHICLTTRFDDAKGYDAYATHPHHLGVVEHMHRVAKSAVKVDYSV